uniref:Uncharacterized protein n=1 Tax=Zooxanthella nutricula TaxID=1333877 RepID=A0A6U6ULZ7_9DINO|mmetsp:Transcript_8546/g.25399  ORF Transcript_8546/g.25399 Transcript_8546/m.25399 type:complete len:164 (+) Transcript_8546:78-569(+)
MSARMACAVALLGVAAGLGDRESQARAMAGRRGRGAAGVSGLLDKGLTSKDDKPKEQSKGASAKEDGVSIERRKIMVKENINKFSESPEGKEFVEQALEISEDPNASKAIAQALGGGDELTQVLEDGQVLDIVRDTLRDPTLAKDLVAEAVEEIVQSNDVGNA